MVLENKCPTCGVRVSSTSDYTKCERCSFFYSALDARCPKCGVFAPITPQHSIVESPAGRIYVLINSAMSKLVKIGMTTKSAELRAEELSGPTGVPSPFIVAYEAPVEDYALAEALVHERLARVRWNDSREFFEIPLREAIQLVEAVLRELSTKRGDP